MLWYVNEPFRSKQDGKPDTERVAAVSQTISDTYLPHVTLRPSGRPCFPRQLLEFQISLMKFSNPRTTPECAINSIALLEATKITASRRLSPGPLISHCSGRSSNCRSRFQINVVMLHGIERKLHRSSMTTTTYLHIICTPSKSTKRRSVKNSWKQDCQPIYGTNYPRRIRCRCCRRDAFQKVSRKRHIAWWLYLMEWLVKNNQTTIQQHLARQLYSVVFPVMYQLRKNI